MPIADSLCRTAETNIKELKNNYIPTEKKKKILSRQSILLV